MTIYTAIITLILVMDPIGNIPIFLAMLRNTDPQRFTRIIVRECAIAFLILVFFLFFGQYILKGLHITESALGIAGGIILFLISLRMIFPEKNRDASNSMSEENEPFIVPLAIPFIAGPSTIATVLLLATQQSSQMYQWFLAVVVASAVFLVTLLVSRFLMRILGNRVLVACERLMGMLLTTVAVQMLLSGINVYFHLGLQ
ncbi:MAG: MarC family protein [Gammaproteobacteria bacterium]